MIKSNHKNHPNTFIQRELNEHDQRLIKEARKLGCTSWMLVHEDLAETVEGFIELHRIAGHLYHEEEAMNGEI